MEITAYNQRWRLGFPTISIEILIYTGHALLLFVSWQFSEKCYSTNLGNQDWHTEVLLALSKPPRRTSSWKSRLLQLGNTNSSFILKFCLSSIKLILVKKKNDVQCHLHSFWWAFSSMRTEIITTSLVSKKKQELSNCLSKKYTNSVSLWGHLKAGRTLVKTH